MCAPYDCHSCARKTEHTIVNSRQCTFLSLTIVGASLGEADE